MHRKVKIKLVGSIAGLFVAIMVCGAVSQATAAGVVQLTWAHILNETQDDYGVSVDKYFASEVEKRTQGRVKINIYWGGSLAKVTEILDLLKNGAIDMGSLYVAVNPSSFPLWSAPCGMPFYIDNLEQAHAMAKRMPKELDGLKREFAENNVKLLYNHFFPNYQLFSTKPLSKYSDLNGIKIRSLGKYSPHAYKAAGAVGVNIPFSEIYTSLKRGVIDACAVAPFMGRFLRIYEVAHHVSVWNIGATMAWGVWINQKTWDKISPADQKMILEIAEEALEMEYKRAVRVAEETEEYLKTKDVSFHEVDPVERSKWLKSCPDFLDMWEKELTEKGKGAEVEEMKALWMEISAKH